MSSSLKLQTEIDSVKREREEEQSLDEEAW